MKYLQEYRRLTGVALSQLEQAAGTSSAMLAVLSNAFSTPVTIDDIYYIRYRPYDDSIDLQDQAQRLGGVLTSVSAREVDLGRMGAFLKKHGAKTY